VTAEADTDDGVARAEDQHLFSPALRNFPWVEAGGAAVATFLVEYLLVAALFVVGPSSVDRSAPAINSTVAVVIQYAHVLFNAHHVPTLLQVPAGVQVAGSALGNDLYIAMAAGEASVPPVVYFLVPMIALTVAGGLFEGRRGYPESGRLSEAALVGTGFAMGYLGVGVVGALTLVQRWQLRTQEGVVGTATQHPDIYFAAVLFFLFPMVFVTLGAALMYGRRQA